jgi:glutamyl/glutaminyl-tRNA synthetase
LNVTYTVLSKRKLLELVQGKYVSGWDDPRMPTLGGIRRRGYTPESLRAFCDQIGVARFNSTVDKVVLENAIRDDLNKRAARVMGVLNPLKLTIENYPAGEVEWIDAVNNPEDPKLGHAQARDHAHRVDRPRRLPRGSAEEVLPPLARQGSAPALRVLRHGEERREERRRRRSSR